MRSRQRYRDYFRSNEFQNCWLYRSHNVFGIWVCRHFGLQSFWAEYIFNLAARHLWVTWGSSLQLLASLITLELNVSLFNRACWTFVLLWGPLLKIGISILMPKYQSRDFDWAVKMDFSRGDDRLRKEKFTASLFNCAPGICCLCSSVPVIWRLKVEYVVLAGTLHCYRRKGWLSLFFLLKVHYGCLLSKDSNWGLCLKGNYEGFIIKGIRILHWNGDTWDDDVNI